LEGEQNFSLQSIGILFGTIPNKKLAYLKHKIQYLEHDDTEYPC
jgi:hypothetical protein